MTRHALRALAACAVLTGAAHAESPLYKPTGSVPLGTPDHWDYVVYDGPTRHVLVAHGNEITIVDATTLQVVAHAGGLQGAHGSAAVPGGRLYADSSKTGTVTAFSPTDLKPLTTIPAALDADGMSYDPATHAVFVVDGDSGSVSAIDTATDRNAGTIAVGGSLEFAAPDGRGHLYVNHEEPPQIVRIDTRTRKVDATWAIPQCTAPHGMAVDPVTRRIFATCINAVMVVLDADSGRLVATLPIGRGSDSAFFDPAHHRVFSPNGDGTLSMFDEQGPDQIVALAPLTTAPGARTGAVDPVSGRLFLVTADVASQGPPRVPGGAPSFTYKPGTVKLLTYDPVP